MDKRQAAEREVEQREVRFRVIEEFLKLRGRNEPNFASWAAILDQNFSLTLPATELSDVAGGEMERVGSSSIKLEKVYSGVADVMKESASFASFLQSLGNAETIECNMIGFVYKCDRSDFFMDDNHAVLDWGAGTTGLTLRVRCVNILSRSLVLQEWALTSSHSTRVVDPTNFSLHSKLFSGCAIGA